MTTRVVGVSSPTHRTLLGVENLTVVQGDSEILLRAERYANLGHEGIPVNDEDAETLRQVLAALLEVIPNGAPSETAPVITQLNISNTYHCNMGCSYCYNELAVKDRKGSETPGGMSRDTARRMIDALIDQSGAASRLTLAFIGGEPLLEKEILYETIAYARVQAGKVGKRVDCAVYTNGLLLDDAVIDWSNSNDVSIIVSLDGPPDVHDRFRRTLGGRPTSARVLRNIARLMERSQHTSRRVRAVAATKMALLPLHRYLLDLGFNEIHVQPVYDETGIGTNAEATDMVELVAWYRERLLSGTVIGVLPFEMILERLAYRLAAVTSWYPCTAGRSSLGVGPDGSLYPCHHFVEESRHRIGDVRQQLPPGGCAPAVVSSGRSTRAVPIVLGATRLWRRVLSPRCDSRRGIHGRSPGCLSASQVGHRNHPRSIR